MHVPECRPAVERALWHGGGRGISATVSSPMPSFTARRPLPKGGLAAVRGFANDIQNIAYNTYICKVWMLNNVKLTAFQHAGLLETTSVAGDLWLRAGSKSQQWGAKRVLHRAVLLGELCLSMQWPFQNTAYKMLRSFVKQIVAIQGHWSSLKCTSKSQMTFTVSH